MFTQQNFEKVAQILRDSRPAADYDDYILRREIVGELMVKFADMFDESNGLFSRWRFLRACKAE